MNSLMLSDQNVQINPDYTSSQNIQEKLLNEKQSLLNHQSDSINENKIQKKKPKKSKKIKHQLQTYDIKEHMMTFQQLSSLYQTDINFHDTNKSKGLTHAEANERIQKYGKNHLSPPPETPEYIKYLKQYTNGFMVLMGVAGLLACIAYAIQPCNSYSLDTKTKKSICTNSNLPNLYAGVILFGIVIFTSTLAYYEERKSGSVMAQFKKMLPPKCRVIRDGHEEIVLAENIVVGDIIKVIGGDRVPADLIIIQSSSLKVEQSAITGEAESITITTESQSENFLESKNLIFNGCFVLEGSALGIVVRTGDKTYIGTIAHATSITEGVETTLHKEVNLFVKYIVVISIVSGALFFGVSLIRSHKDFNSIFNSFVQTFIMVSVANIPQGLPITVTSLLTITAQKLAKKNVYVKTLEGVETLGSTTVIASDKTGTLTQNKMTVQHLWYDKKVQFQTDFFKTNKDAPQLLSEKTFQNLFKVACCCNKAFFQLDEEADMSRQLSASSQSQMIRSSSVSQNKDLYAIIDKPELTKEILEQVSGQDKIQITKMLSLKEEQKLLRQSMGQDENRMSYNDNRYSDTHNSQIQQQQKFSEEKNSPEYEQKIQRTPSQKIQIQRKLNKIKRRKKTDKIIGDASEIALLTFCEQLEDTEFYRSINEKIFEVPFNSKNKYQLSIHNNIENNTQFLVMKGAPEIIIKMCSHYLFGGEKEQITEEFKQEFDENYKNFGKLGERVLGFAYLPILNAAKTQYSEQLKNYPSDNLIFCGLISLIDPPKEGVPEAVELCRSAGIRVAMITGDHPYTAEAIARKVGIIRDFQTKEENAEKNGLQLSQVNSNDVGACVTFGPDLTNFTDEDWQRVIVMPELVFARITPAQKLQIVEQFQKFGEVVAVTGDGVNDSIALKKADIGVAMGLAGNEVAKASADMILMDDNFASIVLGIKIGRILFDNLKKSIAYTLAHCLPELFPILVTLVAGVPLGMNPILLLTIDLFTEQGPAISLAYEKQEDDIMERPPRNSLTDKLVSKTLLGYAYFQAGLLESIAGQIAYFHVFLNQGIPLSVLPGLSPTYFSQDENTNSVFKYNGRTYYYPEQQYILHEVQTAYYGVVVFSQFFHIWMCKTRNVSIFKHGIFSNKVTNIGAVIEMMICFFFIYAPFNQDFFETVTLHPIYWTWALLSWTILWSFNEGRKYWTRKHPKGKIAKVFAW